MKNKTSNFLTIIIILLLQVNLYSQCKYCGIYQNKFGDRIQSIKINSDQTFEYNFNGIYAGLMGGTTHGKWRIEDQKIILNSEYSDKKYQILEQMTNHCKSKLDSFYQLKCDSLIRIRVKDRKNQDIWSLKNVMLNNDTSKVSTIGFEILDEEYNHQSAAYFIEDNIESIEIYNGWYIEFQDKIVNPNSNDIIIKGDFTDESWYTYFTDEEWTFRKRKLIGNKKFGNFKKMKK